MKSIKSLILACDWIFIALVAYAALAVGADTLASFAAAELSHQAPGDVDLNLVPLGCAELACAFLIIQVSTRLYAAALVAIGFGSRLLPAMPEQHLVLSAHVFAVVAVLLIGTTLARRSKWAASKLGFLEAETAT